MTARAWRVELLLVVGLALASSVHARCGDRPGDDAAVADAARTALAACACDGGVQDTRCLRAAIRRVRVADGLRSACRHGAFVAAAVASCTTTLAGHWRLTGDVVENGCNATALLESELEITQNGTSLTARGTIQPYSGTVRSDGWQLNNVLVELGTCPTGEPAEALWLITGTLPGAGGVVAVEQTIGWSSPVAPFFPCPACTVRWRGTMRPE